jgi:hypothetical protein
MKKNKDAGGKKGSGGENGADNPVGYGKPPRHSRFKPGQSGNPKGRPKGSSNFKTVLRKTLTSKVRVTKDGQSRTHSTQEAMLLRTVQMGFNGNFQAANRILQLAAALSEEDESAPAKAQDELAPGDAEILELFKQRLLAQHAEALRKATATNTPKPNQDPEADSK